MRNCLTLFLLVTLLIGTMNAQQVIDLLPEFSGEWKARGEDKIYTPESLYDYIDGGAELYLSYNMEEVASRIIVNGDNEIRIEIFDMTETKNAFGVFSHTRTKDEHIYGQGSQQFTGALIFWKDKYFVALTANDENEIINSTLKKIAGEIDGKISKTGSLPDIINLLPVEGLDRGGYIYFHHYIWLNSFYYISDENILNINSGTDAVLAKYGQKEARCFLLIVDYKENEKAIENKEYFRKEFFDENNNSDIQLLEDGSWVGIKSQNNFLIAVFNTAVEDNAVRLIEETMSNIDH